MKTHCQASGATELLDCSIHVDHAHEKHKNLVGYKLEDPEAVGWEEES